MPRVTCTNSTSLECAHYCVCPSEGPQLDDWKRAPPRVAPPGRLAAFVALARTHPGESTDAMSSVCNARSSGPRHGHGIGKLARGARNAVVVEVVLEGERLYRIKRGRIQLYVAALALLLQQRIDLSRILGGIIEGGSLGLRVVSGAVVLCMVIAIDHVTLKAGVIIVAAIDSVPMYSALI
eukprot:Opistho-2@91049